MGGIVRYMMRVLTSPKKALLFISSGLALLSVARVVVLVCESYSSVRSERIADEQLMQMCDSGEALMSADFRSLCIKKRAERAAPVFFKALLRACCVAFQDFVEACSSPTRILLLVLFAVTGMAAPVIKVVCSVLTANLKERRNRIKNLAYRLDSDDEENGEEDHAEIVMIPEGPSYNRNLRNRVVSWGNRALRGRRERAFLQRVEEVEDDASIGSDALHCIMPDFVANAHRSVGLNGSNRIADPAWKRR